MSSAVDLLNIDSDRIVSIIRNLYVQGEDKFYAGFTSPLVKDLKSVNNDRFNNEEEHNRNLPYHPIDRIVELYKDRTKEKDGTWTIPWKEFGKVLGVEARFLETAEEKLEREQEERRRQMRDALEKAEKEQAERETAKREKAEREKGDEDARENGRKESKGKEREGNPKPKPRPVARQKGTATVPTDKPTTSKSNAPPKTKTPRAKEDNEIEVISAPPIVERVPPSAATKPPAKATSKKADVGGGGRKASRITSKPEVQDSSDENNSTKAAGKSQNKPKKGSKVPTKGAKEKGTEDAEDEPIDVDEVEGSVVANRSEGGKEEKVKEEAVIDLVRRRNSTKGPDPVFKVFDNCAACFKAGTTCFFSRSRVFDTSNKHKIVCDLCKERKRKCTPTTAAALTFQTPLGEEYEDVMFPGGSDDRMVRKGFDGEGEEVRTVGDLFTALIVEQRQMGERVGGLGERMEEVATAVETSPQHTDGLTAAINTLLKRMDTRDAQRIDWERKMEGALRRLTEQVDNLQLAQPMDRGIRASVTALVGKVNDPTPLDKDTTADSETSTRVPIIIEPVATPAAVGESESKDGEDEEPVEPSTGGGVDTAVKPASTAGPSPQDEDGIKEGDQAGMNDEAGTDDEDDGTLTHTQQGRETRSGGRAKGEKATAAGECRSTTLKPPSASGTAAGRGSRAASSKPPSGVASKRKAAESLERDQDSANGTKKKAAKKTKS